MNPRELKEWLFETPDHEIYLSSINDIDEFYAWISEIIPEIKFEACVEDIRYFYERYPGDKAKYHVAFWYGEFGEELYYHLITNDEIIDDAGECYILFNELRKSHLTIEFDVTEFVNLLSI